MTKDEALDALNELLESAKTLRVPPHIGVKNLQGIIAALEEKPLAVWDDQFLHRGSDGAYRWRPGRIVYGEQDWAMDFPVTITITERHG